MILTALLLMSDCIPGSPSYERYVSAGICERAIVKPKPDKTGPITEAEKAAIHKYFDMKLLDGPSARWKYKRGKGDTICGAVNAKNRMGAYTGWTPFYFAGTVGAVVSDQADVIIAETLCL